MENVKKSQLSEGLDFFGEKPAIVLDSEPVLHNRVSYTPEEDDLDFQRARQLYLGHKGSEGFL